MKAKKMKGPPRRNRALNHLYAKSHGYYWMPCPICGEYYGGHEAADESLHTYSAFRGQMVCWRCGERAKELSRPVLEAEGIMGRQEC